MEKELKTNVSAEEQKAQQPIGLQIDNDSKFEIDGTTLSNIVAIFDNEMTKPEMQKFMVMQAAFKGLSETVQKGIADGKITQVFAPEKED